MSRSAIRLVGLAIALALAIPATASASSLVYVKDGNVWLSAPDGSGQYQVTTDGSTSDPYYKPSQADDGTIVAVRGAKPAQLYRMAQNGQLLNAPFATASPMGNLLDAEVSPDGKTVAYTFVTAVNGCYPYSCTGTRAAAAYTYSDHFGDASGSGLQDGGGNWHNVSWASSSRVVLTSNSNLVYYDELGGGNDSDAQWFDECSAGIADCSQGDEWAIHDLHPSRDGSKAAWIWQAADPDPYNIADEPYLQIGAVGGAGATGTPPGQPTTPACHIGPGPKEQAGPGQWDRPTFAPDGSAVAWSEADGIHVTSANLNDCAAVAAGDHVVVPGGFEPFWGPADVNPGPRPGAGGGGTTAGGGDSGGTGGGGTTIGGDTNGGGTVVALSAPKLGAVRARLARVLRKRLLVIRCALAQPGTCSLRMTLSGALARKLHLTHSRRKFVLASGRATLTRAGTAAVKLRLGKRTAARLRHVRSLRVTVAATAVYGSGKRSSVKRLTLRR